MGMSITEQILSREDYVEVSPEVKRTAEFKFAHLLKEEVRGHKWNKSSEGVVFTWEAALQDWMDKHYIEFAAWLKPFRPKKKSKRKPMDLDKIRVKKTRMREPVITGHSL